MQFIPIKRQCRHQSNEIYSQLLCMEEKWETSIMIVMYIVKKSTLNFYHFPPPIPSLFLMLYRKVTLKCYLLEIGVWLKKSQLEKIFIEAETNSKFCFVFSTMSENLWSDSCVSYRYTYLKYKCLHRHSSCCGQWKGRSSL